MIAEYAKAIIICVVAILSGIILGNSAVWVFNRIPGKWLCDYGKEPDEELLHPTHQRIKSTPWKYCFSCLYVLAAIKLGFENPAYALIALMTCWILMEMAIADIKYMIVPDQFVILLMVAAVGFVPHHEGGPFEGIWGGLVGVAIMLTIGLLGKLIYKRDSLGGGDIKVFGALGLCMGVKGILCVFVLSAFLSVGHIAYLAARKRIKPGEERPLVPYIAVSAAICLVILHEIGYNIMVYL